MKTHLFFDLDHTLWDFDKNSHETLALLFYKYELHLHTQHSELDFIEAFHFENRRLWGLYDQNLIDKHQLRDERILNALKKVKIDKVFDYQKFNHEYLQICPTKNHVIPFALEVLEKLSQKYEIHILTNGFETIQELKIANSGIKKYIKQVFTAEKIGHKKPSNLFFKYVLEELQIDNQKCIMIGDTFEADIVGAINSNIDAIYFNPQLEIKENKNQFIEIKCLSELYQIL